MPADCADSSRGLLLAQLSRAPADTVPTRQPRPACSNAGTNAYRVGPLASQQHDDIISIVESNVIGVMLGESKQHTRVGACFLAGRRC